MTRREFEDYLFSHKDWSGSTRVARDLKHGLVVVIGEDRAVVIDNDMNVDTLWFKDVKLVRNGLGIDDLRAVDD